MSPRTVLHAHRTLSHALDDAVRHGVVPRNVAKLQAPPKVQVGEMAILDPDGIAKLIADLRWLLRRVVRGIAGRFDMERRPLVNLGAEAAWFTAITLGVIVGFGTWRGGRSGRHPALGVSRREEHQWRHGAAAKGRGRR